MVKFGKIEIAVSVLALVAIGSAGFAVYTQLQVNEPIDHAITPVEDQVFSQDAEMHPEDMMDDEVEDIALSAEDFIQVREDIDQIKLEAAERLGFVPQGGIPEEIASKVPSYININPLFSGFLTPASLSSDQGNFQIYGIEAVERSETCLIPGGEEFSCYDWSMEGMDILISTARSVRCKIVAEIETEESDENEGISIARCESNLGGDWVDISSWSVSAGLTFASSDDLESLQEAAESSRKGLWGLMSSLDLSVEDVAPISEEVNGSEDLSEPSIENDLDISEQGFNVAPESSLRPLPRPASIAERFSIMDDAEVSEG